MEIDNNTVSNSKEPREPLIFHFVNPNELERNKIKVFKIYDYTLNDTFDMII